MIGTLYIDNVKIGEINFDIIDKSMGAIGGKLSADAAYGRYRTKIQHLYNLKGIANIDDFNLKIILIDGTIVNPNGGIGIIDSADFDEILVESSGIDSDIIEKFEK